MVCMKSWVFSNKNSPYRKWRQNRKKTSTLICQFMHAPFEKMADVWEIGPATEVDKRACRVAALKEKNKHAMYE